jgi:hypothetical protein
MAITRSRWLLGAMVAGTVAAAVLLALGPVLDVPGLELSAVGLIALVLIAREIWLHDGDVRTWLVEVLAIVAAVALVWGLTKLGA